MNALRITTAQAINTVAVSRAIAAFLNHRLDLPVEFVDDINWQERYRMLDDGEIQIAWVCGLPYVVRFDQPESDIELLAAPVMRAERYHGQPVYYSDVVVPRESPFVKFDDLRGASWAYNEPGSQSGYNVTRYHLFGLGYSSSFFGRVVRSGAHRLSLRLILEGEVDASAIDSTVLDWELHHHPEIRSQIRIIETMGPSPIPPWVILKSVAEGLKEEIRQLLLHMHEDQDGRAVLAIGHLSRFAAVRDQDYDVIRRMADVAQSVKLG